MIITNVTENPLTILNDFGRVIAYILPYETVELPEETEIEEIEQYRSKIVINEFIHKSH